MSTEEVLKEPVAVKERSVAAEQVSAAEPSGSSANTGAVTSAAGTTGVVESGVAEKAAGEEAKPASSGPAKSASSKPAPAASDRRPVRGGRVPLEDIAAGIAGSGKQMSAKLRELLLGSVTLKIVDRSRAFTFDPLGGGFKLSEVSGPEARTVKGDCVIELTEMSLQRMWNGDLNPQIAMLSDKVTISGKSELAVYFFNLVSPS